MPKRQLFCWVRLFTEREGMNGRKGKGMGWATSLTGRNAEAKCSRRFSERSCDLSGSSRSIQQQEQLRGTTTDKTDIEPKPQLQNLFTRLIDESSDIRMREVY